MQFEALAQRLGFFFGASVTQPEQDLCHLRCTAGDRSTIRRASQHLGLDMSQFARDAWAWWEEQE